MSDINYPELTTKDFIDEVCEIFNKEISTCNKISANIAVSTFIYACREVFTKYNFSPSEYLKYFYNTSLDHVLCGMAIDNDDKIYHLEIGLKNIYDTTDTDYYYYNMLVRFIYKNNKLKLYMSSDSNDLIFKELLYNKFLSFYICKYIDNYKDVRDQFDKFKQKIKFDINESYGYCYKYYVRHRRDLLFTLKVLLHLSKMDNMKFSSTKMLELINNVNQFVDENKEITISLNDLKKNNII